MSRCVTCAIVSIVAWVFLSNGASQVCVRCADLLWGNVVVFIKPLFSLKKLMEFGRPLYKLLAMTLIAFHALCRTQSAHYKQATAWICSDTAGTAIRLVKSKVFMMPLSASAKEGQISLIVSLEGKMGSFVCCVATCLVWCFEHLMSFYDDEAVRDFEISKWFDACDVWSIVVFVCVACCVSEEERFVVKGMSVVVFQRK